MPPSARTVTVTIGSTVRAAASDPGSPCSTTALPRAEPRKVVAALVDAVLRNDAMSAARAADALYASVISACSPVDAAMEALAATPPRLSWLVGTTVARATMRRGCAREAEGIISRIEMAPSDGREAAGYVKVQLARALMQQQPSGRAEPVLRHAVSEGAPWARYWLARHLIDTGRPDEAIALLEAEASDHPHDLNVRCWLERCSRC